MSHSESVPLSYPVHEDFGDCDPKGVRYPTLKSISHTGFTPPSSKVIYWDVPNEMKDDLLDYVRSRRFSGVMTEPVQPLVDYLHQPEELVLPLSRYEWEHPTQKDSLIDLEIRVPKRG